MDVDARAITFEKQTLEVLKEGSAEAKEEKAVLKKLEDQLQRLEGKRVEKC